MPSTIQQDDRPDPAALRAEKTRRRVEAGTWVDGGLARGWVEAGTWVDGRLALRCFSEPLEKYVGAGAWVNAGFLSSLIFVVFSICICIYRTILLYNNHTHTSISWQALPCVSCSWHGWSGFVINHYALDQSITRLLINQSLGS